MASHCTFIGRINPYEVANAADRISPDWNLRTILLVAHVMQKKSTCARLFICALWSPAGKGLTSWLSFVVSSVSLSLSHWYPGSGVVLDCIDS